MGKVRQAVLIQHSAPNSPDFKDAHTFLEEFKQSPQCLPTCLALAKQQNVRVFLCLRDHFRKIFVFANKDDNIAVRRVWNLELRAQGSLDMRVGSCFVCVSRPPTLTGEDTAATHATTTGWLTAACWPTC